MKILYKGGEDVAEKTVISAGDPPRCASRGLHDRRRAAATYCGRVFIYLIYERCLTYDCK